MLVVRTVGNDNLGGMQCCNAVAVIAAIGGWAESTRKLVLEDHNEPAVDYTRAGRMVYHHSHEVVLGASPYGAGPDTW